MTEREFRHVYRSLIEENPIAMRPALAILDLEFTKAVPTLAVTVGDRPILRVNLDFVAEHCRGEREVAAVIMHELLHVALRHTQRLHPVTPAEHLAFDAVINAIIHRTMGSDASAMMGRYYAKSRGVARLLRPPTIADGQHHRFLRLWRNLYQGKVLAEDIHGLVEEAKHLKRPPKLLGDHGAATPSKAKGRSRGQAQPTGPKAKPSGKAEPSKAKAGQQDAAKPAPERANPQEGASSDQSEAAAEPPKVDATEAQHRLQEAIERVAESVPPGVIKRRPPGRNPGVGSVAEHLERRAKREAMQRWLRETYAVLARHLLEKGGAPKETPRSFTLPVLSPGDARASLRARWSPILPLAEWRHEERRPSGSALVYLDASGSMNAELPLIVALLGRLSPYLKRPFWAFSNVVSPARIEQGALRTTSTGGTSLGCVLAHVAEHRPPAAIILTDGLVEAIAPAQVAATHATRLHVLVTRGGTTHAIQRAGLPFTQLGKVPS